MKAVIMAGGQGTRFWPVSREDFPKQFLTISGNRSMLQQTVARLKPLFRSEDIYVVCNRRHVDRVRTQLPELGEEQVIVEPLGCNTAPCVGLSAVYLRQKWPDEIMVMLPSDHVITDVAEFHQVLQAAEQIARAGWLVTFGIEPSYAANGYGYLQRGERLQDIAPHHNTYQVKRFTEKPDVQTAQKFVRSGEYYWNSGIFVWSIAAILEELRKHMPELHEALENIIKNWGNAEEMHKIFSRLPKISIDFGVMEKAKKVAMIPCRLGWNDVGNWKALEEVWSPDENGLVTNSRYVAVDSGKCAVYASHGKVVALVGVEGLVVVETPDALLVCKRERTEDVKQVVEQLKAKGWKEYL